MKMGHLKTQDIHHDLLIAELETYGLDQTRLYMLIDYLSKGGKGKR